MDKLEKQLKKYIQIDKLILDKDNNRYVVLNNSIDNYITCNYSCDTLKDKFNLDKEINCCCFNCQIKCDDRCDYELLEIEDDRPINCAEADYYYTCNKCNNIFQTEYINHCEYYETNSSEYLCINCDEE